MVYKRLTKTEREHIGTGLALGKGPSELAKELGRSPSTICREIRRNSTKQERYSVFRAQERSEQMAASRHAIRKLGKNRLLRDIVENGVRLYQSPEQISNWLKHTFPDEPVLQISHESISTYLYVQGKGTLKKELTRYLRYQRSVRRPRTGRAETRGKIPEMISIHERPVEVEDRTIPGHWEGDLIMGAGNRSAMGTLAERSSRTLLLVPLEKHDAESVRHAFERKMMELPKHLRLSLTYDQGKEMSQHRLFTEETKIIVYFADPHSPWQRGTNENTNGLVRQFFPKGMDFAEVTAE